MSLTETSDRFIALPDEQTLAATVVALEEHGFSVEVVDDLDAARQAVLASPRPSSRSRSTGSASKSSTTSTPRARRCWPASRTARR